MDFKQAFDRGMAIAQLDREAMLETAADEDALVPALVLIAIGSAVSMLRGHLTAWIAGAVLTLFFTVLWILLMHFLAGRLAGGRGEWMALLRAWGHGGGLISCVRLIP